MNLGKDTKSAHLELSVVASAELSVRPQDKPPFLSWAWLCECINNLAATNDATEEKGKSDFVLAHFILITCCEASDSIHISNCLMAKLLHTAAKYLVPGHSAER